MIGVLLHQVEVNVKVQLDGGLVLKLQHQVSLVSIVTVLLANIDLTKAVKYLHLIRAYLEL